MSVRGVNDADVMMYSFRLTALDLLTMNTE